MYAGSWDRRAVQERSGSSLVVSDGEIISRWHDAVVVSDIVRWKWKIATMQLNSAKARSGQAEVPVGRWLAKRIGNAWKLHCKELRKVRRRPTERAVHELRVSARRLVAQLGLASCICTRKGIAEVRRSLKRRMKRFSALRDIHVQRVSVEKDLGRHPELRRFRDYLRGQELKLVKRAGGEAATMKTGSLEKKIGRVTSDLRSRRDGARDRWRLLQGVSKAHGKVMARVRRVDETNPATIHRVRVPFKRFRYMVEALSPAITGLAKSDLLPLALFQHRMGLIQDLEVIRACILEFIAGEQHDVVMLRRFVGLLERRRARQVGLFMAELPRAERFGKMGFTSEKPLPSTRRRMKVAAALWDT